jgi:hypothetical protein
MATGGAPGTGGSGGAADAGTANGPCAALCTTPTVFTATSYSSGNLGSGAGCFETTAAISGGNCGNFCGQANVTCSVQSCQPRTMSINGTTVPCTGNFVLPTKRNGGYCFQPSAGDCSYAYFVTF